MAEKLVYGLTMGVLYVQGRMAITDMMTVFPDLMLCALFALAFARTASSAVPDAATFRGLSGPLPTRQAQ
jgi:hypothetical protein